MTTSSRTTFSIINVTTWLFIITATILFTTPIGEGDFFWHVKHGQWIWQHKSLPTVDYFSHITPYLANTEHTLRRTAFILKQYWLGQLAFYGIWNFFGEAGMVVLRAITYSGILIFIYQWLKGKADSLVILATIFVIGNELMSFSNERPQLFAYMFLLLLLWVLEKLSEEYILNKKIAISLISLMVIWANTHGSFILGIVIISIYLCSWLVILTYKHNKIINYQYPILLFSAILISGLNPNGFNAFRIIFDMNKRYSGTIAEYTSPITLVSKHLLIDYYYWIPLLLTLLVLFFRFRKIPLRHTLTLLAIGILSTQAQRYIPMFILTLPLIAFHVPKIKLNQIMGFAVITIILIWGVNQEFQNVLKFRAGKSYPSNAIQFLNQTKPVGEVFNPYEWGGYIMLNSNYKVFVDGRGLAENFTELYNNVINAFNWQGILSYFRINIIFINGTDIMSNTPYPLMWQLRNSTDWALVYQDEAALIFLRNIPQNKSIIERYQLGKERITRHIEERREWQLKRGF